MAGGIHPDQADDILDALFGSGSPASWYVGLFTVMPGSTGTGFTEATGGGYARNTVTNNSTNFPAAAAGVQLNGTVITWAAFSAALGTIVGVGFWDASSGGNLKCWQLLTSSQYVDSGQGFEIPASGLSITLQSQGA